MKKTNLFILLTAVIFFASCGSESGKTDESHQSAVEVSGNYKGVEIAYIKNSKLYFYYPESGETKQLVEETEPVFNCVFDNVTNMIYYTVERDSILWLKKAYYQENGVEISDVVNFEINKKECISDTYGEKSLLLFNRAEEVILVHDFVWDSYGFDQMTLHSTAKGGDDKTTKGFDYREIEKFWGMQREESFPHQVKNNDLIYEGKNLTNALGLKRDTSEYGEESIEYTDFKLSYDKSKLMYMAFLSMGDLAHGPLCVANVDGTHQQQLIKDGMSSDFKAFWVRNSILFADKVCLDEEESEYQNQLRLTNPTDNTSEIIAKDLDYFTARELPNLEKENGIKIKKETGEEKYCYVKEVNENNGEIYLIVDYIQYLGGEEAIREAKKRGLADMFIEENGDTTWIVDDDYIILNENPKLRTFLVPENTMVSVIDYDENGFVIRKEVNIKEAEMGGMYSLNVKDGVLQSIYQVYLP